MNLLDLVVRIGVEDEASAAIGNVQSRVSAFAVAFGNIISNVAGAAWNTFMSGLDSGIRRVDILNNFSNVMQQLGVSAEDAAASVDMIKAGLDGLPSRTQDIAQIVQQVKATGIELKDATGITLAFNNAMLAGGQGTEGASRAMEAYTRMLSTGTVDMMHWRALVQTAPAQMNMLAESILGAGKSQSDLYEAMKAGTVTWEQFNAAVVAGNDGMGGFEEQARAATKGISTSLENFSTRIGNMWANILTAIDPKKIANLLDTISHNFSGWGSQIGEVVGPLADRFFSFADELAVAFGLAEDSTDQFTAQELAMLGDVQNEVDPVVAAITGFATTVSDVFTTVTTAASDFADGVAKGLDFSGWEDAWGDFSGTVGTAWDWIKTNVTPHMEEFGEAFGGVVSNIGQFVGNLKENIEGFIQAIQPFIPVIAAVAAAVAGFTIFTTVAAAVASVTAAISGAIAVIAPFATAIAGVVSAFGPAAAAAALVSSAIAVWPAIIAGVVAAVVGFIATNEEAQKVLSAVWDAIGSAVQACIDGVSELLSTFGDAIMGFFQTIVDVINDPIGAITDGLNNLGEMIFGTSDDIEDATDDAADSVENLTDELEGLDGTHARASATASGNATDGSAQRAVSNTTSTIEDMPRTYNSNVNVQGNVLNNVASRIWDTVDAIRNLHDRTVTISAKGSGLSWKGGAWGGIVPHATGGIRIADRFGAGEPLDVVGERGPEAIVPLTSRYGRDFARMMGMAAGEYMSRNSRGGVVMNVEYHGESGMQVIDDMAWRMELLGMVG